MDGIPACGRGHCGIERASNLQVAATEIISGRLSAHLVGRQRSLLVLANARVLPFWVVSTSRFVRMMATTRALFVHVGIGSLCKNLWQTIMPKKNSAMSTTTYVPIGLYCFYTSYRRNGEQNGEPCWPRNGSRLARKTASRSLPTDLSCVVASWVI